MRPQTKQKEIQLTIDQQLDIFEKVFMQLIEYPSHRWALERIIKAKDKIDMQDVKIKLKQLECEIIKNKKGGV